MAALAVAEGYSLAEFMGWTPRFFARVMRLRLDRRKHRQTMAEWGPALVTATLAELSRDRRQRPRSYQVEDFMPSMAAAVKKPVERTQTWKQQLAIIKGIHRALGGKGVPPERPERS